MTGHIFHFAVIASVEPFLQVALVLAQIDPGDAKLLEAKFFCPALKGVSQGSEVVVMDGIRICHEAIVTDSRGEFLQAFSVSDSSACVSEGGQQNGRGVRVKIGTLI